MIDRNPTVVVTSDETLPGIVERLREAASGGHTVHLVVPIDSSLLLTAREFRTLKDAIDEQRLAVQMRTADPLRLQLAERLGVPALALPRPRKPVATVEAPPPGRLSGPRVEPVASEPAAESPPAIIGPTLDPDALWPSQNGPESVERAEAGLAEPAGAALENPPRRWLPVAVALVAVVLGASLAIRFVLPQAVVRIVPKTAPVAESIVFDVTSDGQPLDDAAAFALPAQGREIEVAWTGSLSVTGVRVEPDGTAGGPIELRNASAEPVVVEAGTIVTTESDVEFAFTEAVTVPSADPATGQPGATTGNVRAVQPGSGGNVLTGEIGGRLENGVYYSNRMEPTAGGTDKEFPVVAQEDLDALSAAATAAAPELAAKILAEEESGEAIVLSSVEVLEQQDAFDRAAGEEAESVSLDSALTITVMTYDADAAVERYGPELAARLDGEAPEGFAVSPGAIAYEEPVEIAAPADESERGIRLEVTASADALAVLDDEERAALAAQLAGAAPAEAADILADFPEIASYDVAYHPAWLPEQMPNNAGSIQFELIR